MAPTEQTIPPLEIDPESPWVHEAEAIAASTRHYAELSYRQGMAFRGAQQEAFEGYMAQEAQASGPNGPA